MKTIFERTNNSVKTADVNFTFENSEESVLGLLANGDNHIENNSILIKDGWILKNGVKYKKWFIQKGCFKNFWLGHENIPYLASLYEKLLTSTNKYFAEIGKISLEIIKKGGIAHCIPTH